MGSARIAFVSLWEERNLMEVGTFQPSLGFKDFQLVTWATGFFLVSGTRTRLSASWTA
jgi:hypothetical protein